MTGADDHPDHPPAQRVGVFGGTFDPVHNGHIAVAQHVLQAMDLDTMLMVPAGDPYMRSEGPVADAAHRVAMLEAAVADAPGLTISTVDVDRPGPTYSIDTIEDLKTHFGSDTEYFLVVGADSLNALPRWKDVDRLVKESTLVVVGRPGADKREAMPPGHPAKNATFIKGPMVDVSATEIRRRLAAGQPVTGMIPEPVEDYIKSHGLYGPAAEDQE
ncbi:MAG: nicotinate-nucleotide adenylyltransferase [Dehalococcoidia bacterium]